MRSNPKISVAVVQAAPALFDLEASLQKVDKWLLKVTQEQKTDLVLFPESFLPAYPRGMSFGTVVGSRSQEGS